MPPMGERDDKVIPLAAADDAGTRQRLMKEALRLLAREGLNGVSLRRIVQASGARNASALHYHFGTRDRLIEAISQTLRDWLEPRACDRLDALQQRQEDYSVRDVLEAVFGPVLEMVEDPEWGRDAVQFIARLGWDYGHEGQRLSAEMHQRSLNVALALLQRLMPEVEDEALKFRLILNMNNVYHGLAYRSYLWRSPFGPLSLAEPRQGRKLAELFMDYLEAGVRNHKA